MSPRPGWGSRQQGSPGSSVVPPKTCPRRSVSAAFDRSIPVKAQVQSVDLPCLHPFPVTGNEDGFPSRLGGSRSYAGALRLPHGGSHPEESPSHQEALPRSP